MGLRLVVATVGLLSGSASLADDECQRQADFVFEMVAAKAPILAAADEAQKEDQAIEAWQYQLLLNGESLSQLGVSSEKQEDMARSIMGLNYSDNPEVEVNIFEDYFFLTCEMEKRGEAYLPLKEISKEALVQCWETVASREQFQACLTPLLKQRTGDNNSN